MRFDLVLGKPSGVRVGCRLPTNRWGWMNHERVEVDLVKFKNGRDSEMSHGGVRVAIRNPCFQYSRTEYVINLLNK